MSRSHLRYLKPKISILETENQRLQDMVFFQYGCQCGSTRHNASGDWPSSIRSNQISAKTYHLNRVGSFWQFSFPGPQVLHVAERCALDEVEMFCSIRPPALLHASGKSHYVALAHTVAIFMRDNTYTIPKPIYFRPKIDILFLGFCGPEGLGDFVLRHPEANRIESLAI